MSQERVGQVVGGADALNATLGRRGDLVEVAEMVADPGQPLDHGAEAPTRSGRGLRILVVAASAC